MAKSDIEDGEERKAGEIDREKARGGSNRRLHRVQQFHLVIHKITIEKSHTSKTIGTVLEGRLHMHPRVCQVDLHPVSRFQLADRTQARPTNLRGDRVSTLDTILAAAGAEHLRPTSST